MSDLGRTGEVLSGLPDGTYIHIFSNQKSQFGLILEGLAMQDVGIFMAIWSVFRPFGRFSGHLVYFVAIWYIFPIFWYVLPRKIWHAWVSRFRHLFVVEDCSVTPFKNVIVCTK
jgi:hypothetical protein